MLSDKTLQSVFDIKHALLLSIKVTITTTLITSPPYLLRVSSKYFAYTTFNLDFIIYTNLGQSASLDCFLFILFCYT